MSNKQKSSTQLDGNKASSGIEKLKISNKEGLRITTVTATTGQGDKQQDISYTDVKIIGNGSFGVVYQAKLCDSKEQVAIKKVLQDRRFKNRELQIMKQLKHNNIVELLFYFYSSGEKKDEVYLNLVLEFVPETVYRVARHYHRNKQTIPLLFIKLYMYQLLRSLAYIHNVGICHRDIKPQNLLVDPETGVLKLCDFGSAKMLQQGEPNVSYICSRYYRAPELIFGATDYTCQIDVWSAGCVMAELLLGQPIFPGDSGVDQLVEIIKVLGTPSREQIHQMNPNYTEFKFPHIKAHPWNKVFRPRTQSEAIDLVSKLLEYTPPVRMQPLEACKHEFFNDLRQDATRLPNDKPLPPLFNFTQSEIGTRSDLIPHLVPEHASGARKILEDNQSSAATNQNTQQSQPSTNEQASSNKDIGTGDSNNKNNNTITNNTTNSTSTVAPATTKTEALSEDVNPTELVNKDTPDQSNNTSNIAENNSANNK